MIKFVFLNVILDVSWRIHGTQARVNTGRPREDYCRHHTGRSQELGLGESSTDKQISGEILGILGQ